MKIIVMKKALLLMAMLSVAACFSACQKDNGEEGGDDDGSDSYVSKVWPESGMSGSSYWYLSNGEVQIGVDMSSGGSIFHFSEKGTKKNLLNHFDQGRFMQQSYYDGNLDGSTWSGKAWRWNPIQGGGWDGTKAKVLSKNKTDDKMVVETEPVHWATCQPLPECSMKEEITLGDNYAKVHYTFTNSGSGAKDHAIHDQELPAVFCIRELGTFVTYEGSKPWTNDSNLTVVKDVVEVTAWPFTTAYATECWAAYVNDSNWGIGVYTPQSVGVEGLDDANNVGKVRISAYRVTNSGTGTDAKGSDCSYFSPHAHKKVTRGFKFEYNVYITIGTIDEIRATFKKIHDNNL